MKKKNTTNGDRPRSALHAFSIAALSGIAWFPVSGALAYARVEKPLPSAAPTAAAPAEPVQGEPAKREPEPAESTKAGPAPAESVPQDGAQAHADDGGADATSFLRVASEPGRLVALETAARRYGPTEGAGPQITLVGVVHVGDRAYYRELQALLAKSDVVLYESVMPAGTGRPRPDDTLEERAELTREGLRFAMRLVYRFREQLDRLPHSREELRDVMTGIDPRYGGFLDEALIDGWGRPVTFTGAAEGGALVTLTSLGADGAPGGEGVGGDLALDTTAVLEPFRRDSDDAIQVQLAAALALDFQLDAIDYGRENFRASDLAIDQLERSMREHGSDFSLIEGTLAGSSLPAKFIRAILGVVRLLDAVTNGAMSDGFKVVLVELLADETFFEKSIAQLDPGFFEVLIAERNQVVMDDVRAIIAGEHDVRSVAVFYGAGHMADFERRLADQLGYAPIEAEWRRAITIDLATSAVSEAEVARMRFMVRRMIRSAAATAAADDAPGAFDAED